MHSKLPNPRRNRKGFTLVEIMIVVAIIALIGSIAIPAFQRARKRAQADILMNEMRVTADAFQVYVSEKGTLPASASGFSMIPTGMANYLPKRSTWTTVSPAGGYWYWWNFAPTEVWGFTGLIGIYKAGYDPAKVNTGWDPEQLTQIDTVMDDGDPNNGGIHTSGGWVFYGVK